MRKQTPLIAFAAFMLSAGIAHAQFLFWPQYTFWPGRYAPFKHKHHHRQTNSESAKNARQGPMSQQITDGSGRNELHPQKMVQLVGFRDPNARKHEGAASVVAVLASAA